MSNQKIFEKLVGSYIMRTKPFGYADGSFDFSFSTPVYFRGFTSDGSLILKDPKVTIDTTVSHHWNDGNWCKCEKNSPPKISRDNLTPEEKKKQDECLQKLLRRPFRQEVYFMAE